MVEIFINGNISKKFACIEPDNMKLKKKKFFKGKNLKKKKLNIKYRIIIFSKYYSKH